MVPPVTRPPAFNFAFTGPVSVGLPYLADTRFEGGPLALGELRTALGSNFLVLATALVYFRNAELFLVLALLWAAATVVKLVSFVLDRPPASQAIVGIVVDVVMGLLMYSGYLVYRLA